MTYLRSHSYVVAKLELKPRKSSSPGIVSAQDRVRDTSMPVSRSSSQQNQMYFVPYLGFSGRYMVCDISLFMVEFV